jgi:hypothetical protein
MKQNFIRPDFMFSYWIFAWFIVYYIIQKISNPSSFSFIKQNLNPKLAIIIALIENIGLFGFLLIQKTQLYVLFTFIITTTIFKIIPIYLVYDHTILFPNDIITVVLLFILYNIYLFIWRTNVIEVTQKTADSLKKGKTYTPFFYLLHKLFIL